MEKINSNSVQKSFTNFEKSVQTVLFFNFLENLIWGFNNVLDKDYISKLAPTDALIKDLTQNFSELTAILPFLAKRCTELQPNSNSDEILPLIEAVRSIRKIIFEIAQNPPKKLNLKEDIRDIEMNVEKLALPLKTSFLSFVIY